MRGLEAALRAVASPVWVYDRDGSLRFHNGRWPPGCDGSLPAAIDPNQRLDPGVPRDETVRYTPADGRERVVRVRLVPYEDGTICIVDDKTCEHEAEVALVRGGTLATIGRLAGGVAHDFNNMLTVISGHSQLVARRLTDEEARGWLEEIQRAAARAAAITKRLVGLSQPVRSRPVWADLGEIGADMGRLLRRVCADRLEVTWQPARERLPVRVDVAQIEQVVLNLAVEMRDACAPGGKMAVSVRREDGEAVLVLRGGPTRGGSNGGSGLGFDALLAQARANGGTVLVREEIKPDRWLLFELRLSLTAEEERGFAARPAVRGGKETVLLVDDEELVRTYCGRVLRMNGYHVIEASRPREALSAADDYTGPIHMLVTDVVMPGMGGRELVERLADVRPGMRVLYVSGHPGQVRVEAGAPILSKPFGADTLANAVREILDAD